MAFVVTARWTARAGNEEKVWEAVEKMIAPSRAESGMLLYVPHRDPADPRVFFFYEQYVDEAAYKAHGESAHFQTYGYGTAIPLLETRERAFYETIDV